ncbi:MAG: hypothetical protein IPJ69_03635 [Deltaproteobacteria bacterium]|nr:MAG: hypothetical protein IPJ69_03635 [Deltaproteobacteria bacterium]
MKKLLLVGVVLLNMIRISYADEAPQIPHLLNLQTLIYDSDGNLSSSETVDLTIRILDETQHVVYFENQRGIPVVNGAVNVSVGSNQPLTPDILDPSSGQKFLDISVGAEEPFEAMPLVAVPYSLWAEKAMTVPDESIESRHIKNGTIKVEDLEPLAFSQLTGQASETQIPSTIARGTDLSSHIRSTSAHPASAITVSGHFVTVVAQNVQEFLEKADQKLSEEIVNRRSGQESSTTQTTNLTNLLNTERTERVAAVSTVQTSITNHAGSDIATAHSGSLPASRISGTLSSTSISDGSITSAKISDNTVTTSDILQGESDTNSLDSRYVNEGGDTMSGDYRVNGSLIVNDINMSDFYTNVFGPQSTSLQQRLTRLGGSVEEVARGSFGLRGPRTGILASHTIVLEEVCSAAVGHSGPISPALTMTTTSNLHNYYATFTLTDPDYHPYNVIPVSLSDIVEDVVFTGNSSGQPCAQRRVRFNITVSGGYGTDADGSNPIVSYIVYRNLVN